MPLRWPWQHRVVKFQWIVFGLTFYSHMAMHATRKALSNIKAELTEDEWFGEGEDANVSYLSVLDTCFLIAYAAGLFFMGAVGDRVNRRRLLAFGMVGAAALTGAFGLFGLMGVHARGLYGFIWTLNGLVQSISWPNNVAVMSNWFQESSRGRVLGIWSGNQSSGNVLGSVATLLVLVIARGGFGGWQFAMIVNGGLALLSGVLMLAFLPLKPEDVGEVLPDDPDGPDAPVEHDAVRLIDADEHASPGSPGASPSAAAKPPTSASSSTSSSTGSLILSDEDARRDLELRVDGAPSPALAMPAISILDAVRIPGVISFSLSYAAVKCVNYTLFFWLPFFLSKQFDLSTEAANGMSNYYDISQVVGGVVAGYISDRMYSRRSPIVVAFLVLAILPLFLLQAKTSMFGLTVLLLVTGFLVGGPANLISAAISADLGKHESVVGNAQAEATVTGIVDGTGSAGAALGQLLVGILSKHAGWSAVFAMLVTSCAMASVFLIRLFIKDMRYVIHRRRLRARRPSFDPSTSF